MKRQKIKHELYIRKRNVSGGNMRTDFCINNGLISGKGMIKRKTTRHKDDQW